MAEPENLTLPFLFENSVRSYSEELAVGYVDEPGTNYRDFGDTVRRLMGALRERGISRGDRVAILSENSPRWGMAYFAVVNLGAVVCPILPDFHRAEVHHILRNSGARGIFVTSCIAHKILRVNSRELRFAVVLDDESIVIPHLKTETFREAIANCEPEKEDERAPSAGEIREDHLAEILYTSGTTGQSKGVMLTHRNIVSNAIAAAEMICIGSDDRFLSILPLAHSYECTCGFITPFMKGSKIYYIRGLPTAQTLLPAVASVRPTIILSVPLVMSKIYKKKVVSEISSRAIAKKLYRLPLIRRLIHKIAGKKLYRAFGGELRFMVFGGAATPLEVEEFLTEGNFPYLTGYGLTESAPLLTVNPVGKQRHQSCGVTVPGVSVRIMDADPITGIGEIVARGPNIMQGYYRNEEATKNAFSEDGWLITGDRGFFDSDGYLYIKGRTKNLIVGPSGENIYPEEIEFHLSKHPFVLESLVYEQDGRIVARVHLDYDALDKEFNAGRIDESEASRRVQKLLEEIRREVNAKVANYSRVHKIIEQPEEFKKTPTKKIKRQLYTE